MGPKTFWVQNELRPAKLGRKSLVRIGSVTGEIFLKRTNVLGTNVAWTNVTVTVGICSRWSQKPTFKVWSKSDQ